MTECNHNYYVERIVGQIKIGDKILSNHQVDYLHHYDNFQLRHGKKLKCLNCGNNGEIDWGEWEENIIK
jgi:hypothetical protein